MSETRTINIPAKSEIDTLIDAYQKTGRLAFRHPRNKTISLNGGRSMPEKEAVQKMRDTLAATTKLPAKPDKLPAKLPDKLAPAEEAFADPAEIQRLKNSIDEGETILKNKKLDPSKRAMTERAVQHTREKLAKLAPSPVVAQPAAKAAITIADLEEMSFAEMAQHAPKTTEGIGKQKGKRFRKAKIVATDESGQERTYNIQVSDSGARKIKDEGVTKEQFQKNIARDYAKLPEAARAVAEEYDLNSLNKLMIAQAAAGRDNKEIRMGLLASGKAKRQIFEKHPGITMIDAAMKALVADAQPAAKGKQPWEMTAEENKRAELATIAKETQKAGKDKTSNTTDKKEARKHPNDV